MTLQHHAGKPHHLLCVTVGCVLGTDLAVELGNLSFAFLSVLNRLSGFEQSLSLALWHFSSGLDKSWTTWSLESHGSLVNLCELQWGRGVPEVRLL